MTDARSHDLPPSTDKAVMENPQPDIVNGGSKMAQTPELPPPHLLLDLGVKAPVLPGVPDTGEEEPEKQASSEAAERTSIPEQSSDVDPTSAGASEIRSSSSSVKEDRPKSRSTPDSAKSKSPTSAAKKEEEVVERRRKRVPSAPRASSGIPRLSGNAEPNRRSGRTVSESRQRPKSEVGGSRGAQSSTSRSANFGYSRRPHSTVDGSRGAEVPTSPTGGERWRWEDSPFRADCSQKAHSEIQST